MNFNRNPFADVPQIDPRTAQEEWERGDADLVDVREESEWDLGHIEGVQWIPLGQLPTRWRELDPARKLICVCRSGNRSNYAAAMLRQAGIDAANMSGGMLEWKQEKLPITPPGIIESH
ncbi:MAG TPA: rhodanese-like domain-containing protein [Chloroflexia bacterium]|nr:rhodanese-like domain-containing protein [Chloroflexia bacterium]